MSYEVEMTDKQAVYEDISLREWCEDKCYTKGGKEALWNIVSSPIYNEEILRCRQKSILQLGKDTRTITRHLPKITEDMENNVTWILDCKDLKDLFPINALFLKSKYLHFVNHSSVLLNSYHTYRCLLSPLMNIFSPIITIVSPWLYLKNKMGLPLTLGMYINILYITVKELLLGAESIYRIIIRLISVITYIFFYVYNLFHGMQYTMLLYRVRNDLLNKAKSLVNIIKIYNNLFVDSKLKVPKESITSVYTYVSIPKKRAELAAVMSKLYETDAMFVATKLLFSTEGYTLANYASHTRLYNMRHISLPYSQVPNPCDLQKNIIITGPNAAGKTTYTKAICANIILAQSLGIVRAVKNTVCLIHAINSFMRVSDTIGKQSLFEAEIQRCANIVQQAETISQSEKRALYFLDEPMHSTPPVEGTSASFAVLEHLGKLPGIRVILTTHYHQLKLLETENESYFINVSIEAIKVNDSEFIFPYLLRRGFSTQSIALELLQRSKYNLNPEIVERAIKIKNKLCNKNIYEL